MLHEIAKVVGLPFDDENARMMIHLRRVERKMPLKVEVDIRNKQFKHAVALALVAVHKEGPIDPNIVVADEVDPDAPRVLKIKSVPKGERLDTVAANGIRYSFGPKWNDSVMRGKGIAVSEANREKLVYQALLTAAIVVKDMNNLTEEEIAFIASLTTKEIAAKIAPLI
jgi:hypothetical protein